MPTTQEKIYLIADELRAVASAGLYFSEQEYDRERYEKVLKASARLVAALDGAGLDEIYAQYTDNLAHLSPLLGVEALVFRAGKVLLIRRRDNGLWAAPGGLAEVGETLAQAAERELWEEAGLRGQAARLLGLYDSRLRPGMTRMHLFCAQFLVESEDEPRLHAPAGSEPSPLAESLAVDFFSPDALPPLSPGHAERLAAGLRVLGSEAPVSFFDP